MTRLALLAPLALLAACEPADNEPGPGGVTVGEAKALDDAAEMLEQRRLPPEVLGGRRGTAAGDDADAPPRAATPTE